MKRLDSGQNKVTIELSQPELDILSNALNEICNGIDLTEFETRIGASKRDVLKLLNQVRSAGDAVK